GRRRRGQGTRGRYLERGRNSVGAPAHGLSAAFCGRPGFAGDRRGHRPSRRDRESASVSRAGNGAEADGRKPMNEHLSPEDISRWFAGEGGPELRRHAGECEACSARLDRMESAMAEFRGSVHDWSAAQSAAAPHIAWQARQTTEDDGLSHRRPPVRHLARTWILAAASLLILASGPAWWHYRQQARAAEMARADALP